MALAFATPNLMAREPDASTCAVAPPPQLPSASQGLAKQDLATLDLTKLTPLTPEVISRQATINVGTIGHVAHGKSTVVKAISGVKVSGHADCDVVWHSLLLRRPAHGAAPTPRG